MDREVLRAKRGVPVPRQEPVTGSMPGARRGSVLQACMVLQQNRADRRAARELEADRAALHARLCPESK